MNKGSLDEIIQQVLMSVNNGRWQVEEFKKMVKNEFKVVSIFDHKLQKNMADIQKKLDKLMKNSEVLLITIFSSREYLISDNGFSFS